MIKNYKTDISTKKPEELQLLTSVNNNYNTWRVYFDIIKDSSKNSTIYKSKYIETIKPKEEKPTSISILKELLLKEVSNYDLSSEVNSFKLNGINVWLDKTTRIGLMNSTVIQKNSGLENTTLWLDTLPLTINCDLAIKLLSDLEIYALECFNKTAEHKSNIENLNTVDDLINYDYTLGYPEKLVLNTTL